MVVIDQSHLQYMIQKNNNYNKEEKTNGTCKRINASKLGLD
jgi:hypothetical protein